ncbi:hypothetical protein ACR80S_14990 [Halomonas sp. MA07-2]|uniref:hypothetical protein n=1 Tax=unclassified Halomonas TaxID=2609666 RepID=UPI003EE89BDF
MMMKQLFKKAGVLGLSLGLLASPLAFADMHDPADEEYEAGEPTTTPSADLEADAMEEPGAPAEPGTPADEPGFGSGTEPMPTGEGGAEPDEQGEWELPDDEASPVN